MQETEQGNIRCQGDSSHSPCPLGAPGKKPALWSATGCDIYSHFYRLWVASDPDATWEFLGLISSWDNSWLPIYCFWCKNGICAPSYYFLSWMSSIWTPEPSWKIVADLHFFLFSCIKIFFIINHDLFLFSSYIILINHLYHLCISVVLNLSYSNDKINASFCFSFMYISCMYVLCLLCTYWKIRYIYM